MRDGRSRPVAIWLLAVALLVLAMVVVGGATRLTGSAAGVFSVPGEPALPPVLKSRQRLLAPLVS